MTNYNLTMDILAASTFHPDSVEQARKYLRDLKASHEILLNIVNNSIPFVAGVMIDPDVLAALKSAEALR